MWALFCWRGIWKIYNEESLHRIFIFSKHSFSEICVIIRASVGMRFFFLFFTSQLRHITIRLCFSPLFSQPNKPQFSRAICNVKDSSDSLSLLSFVLGGNVLRVLYEVLAFSLKLLQFFWTRWSWACATIWLSVEVKFFSPFFLGLTDSDPIVRIPLPGCVFLPPFSAAGGWQKFEKNSSVSPVAVFSFWLQGSSYLLMSFFNNSAHLGGGFAL